MEADKDTDSINQDIKEPVEEPNTKIEAESENIFISAGTQNNYFYEHRRARERRNIYTFEQISKTNSLYITHRFDTSVSANLNIKNILLLYGEQGIGKFSCAFWLLGNCHVKKIICFEKIDAESFEALEWEENAGYIFELGDEDFKINHSFLNIQLRELIKKSSYIIFIITYDMYSKLDAEISNISMEVFMPTNKIEIIRKRMLNIIKEENLGDSLGLVAVVNSQLEMISIKSIAEKAKKVDYLVRFANKLARLIISKGQTIIDSDLVQVVNELSQREAWREIVESLDSIQEKLFLLVLACLNGFSKKRILECYKFIELEVYPMLSLDERTQIDANVFFSLPWNRRAQKLGVSIIFGQEGTNDTDYAQGDSIEIDAYTADKLISYFLKEFDWYTYIKKWLILIAITTDDIMEIQVVAWSFSKMSMSMSKYTDLRDSLEIICLALENVNKKSYNNEFIVLSQFLRCTYEYTENETIKKKVLNDIHNYLADSSLMKKFIGINVCTYGFADLYLHNLLNDLLAAYYRFPILKISVVHCFVQMLYSREHLTQKSQSLFHLILNNVELWERQSGFVNLLLNKLKNAKRYKWVKSKHCGYQYPLVLYIFAINKAAREPMIKFISKCLNSPLTNQCCLEFLKSLVSYVYYNKYMYNLDKLYTDFAENIKVGSSYARTMLNGIENSYRLRNENLLTKSEDDFLRENCICTLR